MISISSVQKYCKHKSNMKLSQKALVLLRTKVIDIIKKITRDSTKICRQTNRNTIKIEDVLFFHKCDFNTSQKQAFHSHSIKCEIKKITKDKFRIGKNVTKIISLIIQEKLSQILDIASKITKHKKRKIIQKEDIEFAIKTLNID
ncbi:MAG: NFYB/HAP3 family transcription factor subunit [Candidatus Micrarchaeota archaeon]|nr:NFYB/HAP3 family transcription factor subunit [Candidatus Micrarchaeota archaeon]